jgi:predicted choloylglycine hydrolase
VDFKGRDTVWWFDVHKRFIFAEEERPGAAWLARFIAGREEARRWYFGEGRGAAATAVECRTALGAHMPELLLEYDRVCALVGDDVTAHQILSHYRPPPMSIGCSQAIWLGTGGPALVRNYDYSLDIVSDRFELTSWFGRNVIAKAQRPWGGCLDGMNEDGLAVSCAFGGSPAIGRGFSIIIMMRYVLEICNRVSDAVKLLRQIPVAQSQNVMLLDRSGNYATVFLGPDRAPVTVTDRICTNHQERVIWPEHAAISGTVERRDALSDALAEPSQTLEGLVKHFLAQPLYCRRRASPTVYTAVYRPNEGRVDYIWPGTSWSQSFDQFATGQYTHAFGDLIQ